MTITNLSGAVDYCVATNKAAITDSTLKITNPSGFGVYVTKISTQVSEYKASITNSTISAYVPDAGIHCEEEMAVTNSQVTGSGRFLLRSKKAITVDDSSTMKGIIYEFFNSDMGAAYQVYGSHTLAANLTVAENGSFVIPDGAALTIPDGIILENNGTMRIHEKDSLTGTGALTGNGKFLIDVNEDMISVPEGRVYTGKDYTDQIILEENATVCGVEFTADTKGWTRNIEPAVVKDAGEYKVTFTKGGKEISKTFTVAQSGTQFVGDGVVKTYKGSVVCSDFTADDTITVKATPTATGAAPTKAAARLRSGPTAGQMAVFVGDMQVSEAVDVGADGSYAIAVKAADVLKQGNVVPNGDPITLTAKFVGNNNMAGVESTVDVTISAVAKVEITNGTTAYYGAIKSAWEAALTNTGSTLTLLSNAETSELLEVPVDKELSLDCGAFALTGTHGRTIDLYGTLRFVGGRLRNTKPTGTCVFMYTAKATVTGTSFEGTVELSFSIGKATPTIAWDPSYQVLTYTGQPADIKPVITLVNGETYDGPIYYTWPGFTNQLVLPTDAGFNGITASIPAKGNYTAAETEQALILQINKANQDAPSAPTAAEENIKGNRITLDTIENAEYKRDEGEWQTSPVFTGLDPNHEYTFYVRLKEDKNHNASPSSAGAAITTKKTMLDGATVTVSGSYTYTGAAVVPAAGNVTVELNGVTIDASQYTIGATNNVNVGTSTLTVTATADGNYSGSATVVVTISKATPSLILTPSPATLPNGGMVTLTLSGLPDRSSATVTCSDENITVTKGSGNTWTAELPAGGASYTFAASYAGDGNHNGTTANCTVSVDKISPTLKLSPSSDTKLQ